MKSSGINHQPDIDKSGGWTVFVRLTHWLVAACVLVNFFNDTGFWHRTIGYSCVGLVLLRVVYGVLISKEPTSRFYLPGIHSLKLHIKELLARQVPAHVGHNPLGQWAVYLMWFLIILLAFTGWLCTTDEYWGEDWPIDLHMSISNALQGLVVLHLVAVILMSKLQKENLIKKMIRK